MGHAEHKKELHLITTKDDRQEFEAHKQEMCLALDKDKGAFQQSLDTLVALDQRLGLTKLLSEIRSDNFAALRMHLALGYRIVGTLCAHFRDVEGKAHDVLLCERQLRDDGP